MSTPTPRVLTIASSDSGGGAGIQADLKAFARCGAHGMSAIVALTAQNTLGVTAIHELPPSFVRAQIDAVLDDIGADAAKTGMLFSKPLIEAVADALAPRNLPLVVDPVMVASSGSRLLLPDAIGTLIARLFPLATVVTPNLPEAQALTGIGTEDRAKLAEALVAMGARAALVTGGHGAEPVDHLFDGSRHLAIPVTRCRIAATHGAGCTHSAALAAGLAAGLSLAPAARQAATVATDAVTYGLSELGGGEGPVHVLHDLPPVLPVARKKCFESLVKTTISRVVFRNMTSEHDPTDATETPQSGGELRDEHGRLKLTDPKAIRALAHPVRWALLEALGQAGTLTATQASEMLGESPANCAFHLRTLAKYGFVEEAGGGRGRERPWRQSYEGMSLETTPDDPPAMQAAAQALNQVWMDRMLTRAQRSLTSPAAWPKSLAESLGAMASREYVTAEEARELYTEIQRAFERLFTQDKRSIERRDPKLRPADAIPVEFILLAYPVLDLPPLPGTDEGDAEEGESLDPYAEENRAETDREAAPPEGADPAD